MVSIDFSGIIQNLKDIYESEMFPFLALCGGVMVYAFTYDIIWVAIGIIVFFVTIVRRS